MNASLEIRTAWKHRTVLTHTYYTPPFKVADITEDRRSGDLHLMLMNASPGILEGDQYEMNISVAENSRLYLYTQSYQRIFTMQKGACQSMHVQVARNARFFFLPHPVVPHKGAHFTTTNSIHLSAGAELLWAEILTCGRKGCGEIFLFSHYHNLTTIYLDNRIVVRENVLLCPARSDLQLTGLWERYTHQASLLYLHHSSSIPLLVAALRERLQHIADLQFGVSATAGSGLVLKILGNSGEQLFDLIKDIAAFIGGHGLATALLQQPLKNC